MTTTIVDTQVVGAGSGGRSTPVKLTLQGGTAAVSVQLKVTTTTKSITPGILTNSGKDFTMYWAFSPDDLTLANVPTLLRHCAKSQRMTLNADIEVAGQRVQVRDKPAGQYMYLWFEYPASVDGYTIVLTVTELFFSSSTSLSSLVAMPANTAAAGAGGEYSVDGNQLAIYVPATGWVFFTGFQI